MKNIISNRNLWSILLIGITFFIQSCSEDTIDAEGLGTIKGKVVLMGTNEPLANVKVSTNPNTSTVFTNEEGIYTLENIPEGDYSLSAEREDLLAEFEAVTVLTDKEVEIVFEMEISTANNRPPNAAVGITPVDNAEEVGITTELKWSGSDPEDDTLTYKVTLRNEANDEVEVFENLTDTILAISDLAYNTRYFWQVASNDGINESVNSSVYAFQTVAFPSNRIVFARQINDNNVLFSTDETGTEVQLTAEDKNSFRPRQNKVVSKIAFLRTIGATTQLFIMNQDGTDIRQVTSTVAVSGFNLNEVDYSWDTDGASILFPNQDKLYRIAIDGSGLSLIYQTSNGNLITEIDQNDATGKIALKTNDLDGYNTEIITINESGILQETVITGEAGAAGGINFSVDGSKLLYTRDISGFENPDYRQLDSHIMLYDFNSGTTQDLSVEKTTGTNDLDVRFSPNEASVIFTNTSNDGISQKNIFIMEIDNIDNRTLLKENGSMPDWE
ncbi:carboxypeptidase regulatory-like domain-containing protein [Aquimarina rhabdastrellae]